MNIDIDQFYKILGDTNNLLIIFLIAVGYVVKAMPFIDNKYLKTVVVVSGIIIAPFFIQPLARAIVLGVVYAAVSMLAYDFIISKVEGFFKSKFGGDLPNYLKALVLGASILLVGCSSLTPNYSSLPSGATAKEKKDALKKDAVLKLKDPAFQKGIHDALVFAGRIALREALSSEDRQGISSQLYSWGNAFESLATGGEVSPEDLEKTAKTFNTSFDAEKNSSFINSANGAWMILFPLLQQAEEAELTRQWLVVLSSAARDAAK